MKIRGYLLKSFFIVLILIGIFQLLVNIFLGDVLSNLVANTLNLQGEINGSSVGELWSIALRILVIFLAKSSIGVVIEIGDAIIGSNLMDIVDSDLGRNISNLTQNMTGEEVGLYLLKIILVLLLIVAIWVLPFVLGGIFFTLTTSKKVNEIEKARIAKDKEYESKRNLLLSDVAHDIKTPVTTVAGFAKALAEGAVPEEKVQEYLNAVYVKSMQVGDLVSLLFEYVKLDSAGFQLQKTQVNLCELVRKCVARLYTDFEEKNMELKIDIPEEEILLELDELQTERAVNNLLSNSLKHNPAGTVVTVELRSGDSVEQLGSSGKVRLHEDGDRGAACGDGDDGGTRTCEDEGKQGSVILEISDNGSRIERETAMHLFDPFVQGDASRTSGSGSGLGLSITKKIIDMQGGRIVLYQYTDVEKHGKVKTFQVTFSK